MILCLLIDFEEVFASGSVLDPDAVAMLGELRRLQQRLDGTGGGQRLTIVLADFGAPSARQHFDTLLAATGDEWVLARATQDGTVAGLCRGAPDQAILIARSAEPKLADAIVWRLGDSNAGLASPADVERRVRETMHVPVARTVDPARRTGALMALPAAAAAARLLAAAYRDPTADWLTLGAFAVVYLEDGDVEDELAASDGAVRVASSVNRRELYVTDEVPGGLFGDAGYSLVRVAEGEKPPAGARPWSSLRRKSLP